MANRFWVGGTGNWSDTAHWSATTGGSGGQTVPGTADDVFLDGSSGAGTITLDSATQNCKGFDCTGYTGTLDLNAKQLISGNTTTTAMVFKLVSGMTLSNTGGGSGVGQIFISPAAGGTTALTSGTKAIPNLTCQNAGVVTLQDALTVTFNLALTGGTLDTNSKAVSCAAFGSSNSTARTLTLGSTTMTITTNNGGAYAWDTTTITNLTVNSGTSTILFNGSSGPAMTQFGGVSLFNVSRIAATPSNGDEFNFVGNLTVTGTLTISADNATTHRMIVKGCTLLNLNVVGTARTITAAAVSLTNVDFQDIVGAGAATWSGASLGNAGGNTGITFVTPVTRYGVAAGNWSSTAVWSTTSGGTPGASAPICHDTVILDASSGAGTYTLDTPRPAKDLTCTGFTRTLSGGITVGWYGSVILSSGMTLSVTGTHQFFGRNSCTITSAGKSFGGVVQINCPGSSYTLQDNLTTTASMRHIQGTFAMNGFTVTAPSFINTVQGAASPPNISFGGGTMVLNGTGTIWNVNTTMTTTGGGLVDVTDTSSTAKTFTGSSNTYNFKLRHSATGSAGLTISGSNYFAELDLECTTARTITLTASTTQTCGTLTLQGASGQVLSLVSSSPGTAVTLKVRRGHLTKTFDSESGDVTIAQFNMQTTMLLGVG